MANQFQKTILEEGPRNAIVRLSALLDTSDLSWVSAVQLSDFTNNEPQQRLVGLRLNEVEFSVSEPTVALLAWNAASPQTMVTMAQSGEFDFCKRGGLLPDQTRSGYDGSINLTTTGFFPGTPSGISVLLMLVKLYRY